MIEAFLFFVKTGLFFLCFSSFQLLNVYILPIAGFEPGTSNTQSDHSTNWATTTALLRLFFFTFWSCLLNKPGTSFFCESTFLRFNIIKHLWTNEWAERAKIGFLKQLLPAWSKKWKHREARNWVDLREKIEECVAYYDELMSDEDEKLLLLLLPPSTNATRFGETLPLWQKFTSLLQILKGAFWFGKMLGILWHYWANFHCCKWANIEK